MSETPFIPANKTVTEFTLRAILLAIFLTILLAMANAYLALKVGILTSASIPAAILSMGVLRFYKNSSVLENNLVQTAASAGEAVAGGIVYTIPALIIIHYWQSFSYIENAMIAVLGGILGVLFSIPLRRVLVKDKSLTFPEGRAIAEVLKSSSTQGKVGELLLGGLAGALIQLFQTGFKIIANEWQLWFSGKKILFGFGGGFSVTMIGAGYLMGIETAVSIFIGAVIAWGVLIPALSSVYSTVSYSHSIPVLLDSIVNDQLRYIGIGSMLCAGVFTFFTLLKPLIKGIQLSFISLLHNHKQKAVLLRTERDISYTYVIALLSLVSAILFIFLQNLLPLDEIGFQENSIPSFIFISVFYVLIIGFLFSAITGYFSGLVGVSASPGSSVIIAGMWLTAGLVILAISIFIKKALSIEQIRAAEATTIMIGSVIAGSAAIANDNIQDLKVGHILGATPWRQQIMLMLGVVVSALIIPVIMQLLFNVYGIAGVLPHEGMASQLSLPAPPAALMATITQAMFNHHLPWNMLLIGGAIILLVILFDYSYNKYGHFKLSILGVAVGMYLPLASSIPLFMGGLMAYMLESQLMKKKTANATIKKTRGILLACGLVAGSAIMDVFLAIPFSIARSPNALAITGQAWQEKEAVLFALAVVVLLCIWFYRTVCLDAIKQ